MIMQIITCSPSMHSIITFNFSAFHFITCRCDTHISSGDYSLPPYLSREAKDLIKRLLTTNPSKRYTLEQAVMPSSHLAL